MTCETRARTRTAARATKARGALASAWWVVVGVLGGNLIPHSGSAQETPEEAKQMADKLFDTGDFGIDDVNPEAKIPDQAKRNEKPVQFGYWLMTLSERAEAASERGDHATAIKYFRAITAAVPESVGGPRKLCSAYEANGERAKAEDVCGGVLLREGVTVGDYVHYARIVLAQPEPLTAKQIERLDTVITHVRKGAPEVREASELQCQLGLRLTDEKRMADCTEHLNQMAPDDPKTISYAWLYAIMRLDREDAWKAVERAKLAKLETSVIDTMENATRNLRSPLVHAFYQHSRVVFATAMLTLVMLAAGLIFRRRAQRAQHAIPTGNRVS